MRSVSFSYMSFVFEFFVVTTSYNILIVLLCGRVLTMLLLSCSSDVKLHDCSNFELVGCYRPSHSGGYIKNVSWCKDGCWLVLVPNNGNPEVVRAKEDVKVLHSVLGVPQPLTAIFQRSTKKALAISTHNGSVLLYDIKSRQVKKQFVSSGGVPAPLLSWNAKDTHLAAGSTDGQVNIYSNTTNQKSNTFRIPNSKSVSALRFHPVMRPLIAGASDEGVVSVWDINVGKRKFLAKSHQAPVTDLVFSPKNSRLLISAALDRTFQCYDTDADKPALSVLTDHPLSAIDISPDAQTLAVGTIRGSIYIYDLRELKVPLKVIAAHASEIRNVFYQPTPGGSNYNDAILQEMSQKTEQSTPTASVASDLFSDFGSSVPEIQLNIHTDGPNSSKKQQTCGDSFLNEFSACDSTSPAGTPYEARTSNKNNIQTPQQQSNSKIVQIEVPHIDVPDKCMDTKTHLTLKSSSTPKENRVSFAKTTDVSSANFSSVLGASAISNCNINDLRLIVREVLADSVKDTVKEVVKDVVESKITELDSSLRSDLNKSLLDIQWILSTISVYQKLALEKNMQTVHLEPTNTDLKRKVSQLEQENAFLRNQIEELLQKNYE